MQTNESSGKDGLATYRILNVSGKNKILIGIFQWAKNAKLLRT